MKVAINLGFQTDLSVKNGLTDVSTAANVLSFIAPLFIYNKINTFHKDLEVESILQSISSGSCSHLV